MRIAKSPRVLYQFALSHYCEKTRWNLDAKALDYQVKDLPPGVHTLVTRRSGVRTLPMLVDHGHAVGDSVAIAVYLDRSYPGRPLLPVKAAERARALELEEFFGNGAGKAVRLWMYGQLMATRPLGAAEAFFSFYRGAKVLTRTLGPLFEAALKRAYHITPARIDKAFVRLNEAMDRLDEELGDDPDRYLVGDSLSIADITACSLLGPLVAPANSPWAASNQPDPGPINDLRERLSTRPAWAYINARYAKDRDQPKPQ